MPTNEQSTFVAPNYIVDQFDELQDLRYSDLVNLDEYRILKMQKNDGLPVDETRLEELELIFQNKIVTSSRWNKFQQALVGTQTFLKNEVQDYVVSKQEEMQDYVDTKTALFDAKLNRFTFLDEYNPIIQYTQWNVVSYQGESYLCILDSLGNLPTNQTYFKKIAQKGATGPQGEDGIPGIGISFVGTYSATATYDKDQAVYYNGSLYASLQDGLTGFLPTDDTKWSLIVAQGASVLVTTLRNTVTINTSVSNVQFLSGGITAFNKNTDSLFVYVNSTYLELTQDYTINANGISIDKVSGSWDGTNTPITFNFVVIKNLVQSITFNDGSLIDNDSIINDKLNTDIKIGSLATLTTTEKSSVVGAINEIDDEINVLSEDVGSVSGLNTTSKEVVGAINEVNTSLSGHQADYAKHGVDNGRYQAEFGWHGAVLNNLTNTSDIVLITAEQISGTVTKTITPSNLEVYGNLKYDVAYLDANNGTEVEVFNKNYGENAIPIMTSNTTPSGVASSSSTNALREPYMAFDESCELGGTLWQTVSGITQAWLQYEFPTTKIINSYDIGTFGDTNNSKAPKDWTFEGSNDEINWTVLDTRVNITTWGAFEIKHFEFSNTNAYKYYRVNVSANNGDVDYIFIALIRMYEYMIPLKSQTPQNGKNILDLSDIDITQCPSLKVRWTLTRDSVSDESPTVSGPSVTWEGKSSYEVWEKIADVTLTSDVAQVDFTSISNVYKNFKILFACSNTITGIANSLYLQFNNDTGSNYHTGTLQASVSSSSVDYSSSGTAIILSSALPGTDYYLSSGEILIFNYDSTKQKQLLARYITGVTNDSSGRLYSVGGTWKNITNLINAIKISASSGTIAIGSRITLWGCK